MASKNKYPSFEDIRKQYKASTWADCLVFMAGLAMDASVIPNKDFDEVEIIVSKKPKGDKSKGKAQRRHNTETAHAKRLRKYGAGWASPEELKENLDPRELGMLMEGEGPHWENWHMDSLYHSGKTPYSNPRKKQQPIAKLIIEAEESFADYCAAVFNCMGDLERYNYLLRHIKALKHDIEIASKAFEAVGEIEELEKTFANMDNSFANEFYNIGSRMHGRKEKLEEELRQAEYEANELSELIPFISKELERLTEKGCL